MTTTKEKDFIKEIIFCIRQSDIVKAKALVQFFAEVNPKTQNRVLYELSKSPDEIAFPVLDYLCEIKSNQNHINEKIYDLLLEISYGNPKLIAQYIHREHPGQETYIKIAGDLKMREAIPVLSEVLNTSRSEKIREEAIRSLGAIGAEECVSAVSALLHSDDVVFKVAAISALSEIGTPSAIEQLSGAVSGDKRTDAFIINALADIQSKLSMEKLCEMLTSKFSSIRSMSIESLTKIGPKSVPSLIENLTASDTDAQVHTLTVLGKIGDKTAAPAIQKLLFDHPDNSNVRFGAYEALGQIRSLKTAISLANGLNDPDEQVRLAAAKAIDNNLTHVLTAGLKNLIKTGDQDAKKIVAIFIDAEADCVFQELVDWDVFPELASDYLAAKANPATRDHYLKILTAAGKTEMADKINASVSTDNKKKRKQITAIDDSIMMLKLYSKKLHEMGYAPSVFQLPVKALQEINKQKPDLVLTDLNMPELDGLQLTKEIRRKYSQTELPIIMITTQSDFVGGTEKTTGKPINDRMIKQLGVNRILHKPFTEKDLAAAIAKALAREG
ncbi:MAG: response regulator [Desulfobacteraceae bacterium]|nr:MAG: response regulator [Desulfobacteraceae bacterium]